MEVELYVYDLTRGMARTMSRQFLGIQIDAVYHTALVFGRVEYFFGAGVQTCYPGTTHHGQPMEVIKLGTTQLPLETILEYLESLKEVYTPESYDLFAHNCNNFTNDFAMFLLGKGIPEHITNLPERVLETPFGQMLRPQIDASMRSITQAEVPQQNRPAATNGVHTSNDNPDTSPSSHPHLKVKVPTLEHGSTRPITYAKVPPLDKLMVKLGEASKQTDLAALKSFIEKRSEDPKLARLPNLHDVSRTFQSDVLKLPLEVRFSAVDLLRCSMIDPRVSGYFAEERQPRTVPILIQHVLNLKDCPHNLRLVTLHLACNVFASPLYVKELMESEDSTLSTFIDFITSSLLDASHPTTRVAAASLAFNLAVANYRVRREQGQEGLSEGEQVELAASLLETLSDEKNEDAAKAVLTAFGYLVYCSDPNGELADVCKAMDAKHTLRKMKTSEALANEIASLL
ncbi:Desumoylating isopeptidase 1 [Pseudocercospora fuligena]|uniref:Desumoylating isopeptidase 1 n=1 Tax=Pseudocercospora fuligena TaxID=685502 RepID=A0A8H6VAE2_9PEZI|nr:Desumoylating isopeptidase 1 [Pseudocercospora fuligena]